MKQEISLSQFRDSFRDMGREKSFSYEGLEALYNYYEEVSPDMELDVIAIDCEFSEYASALEAEHDRHYGIDFEDCGDSEERETVALEYFGNHTTLLTFEGGIIIGAF